MSFKISEFLYLDYLYYTPIVRLFENYHDTALISNVLFVSVLLLLFPVVARDQTDQFHYNSLLELPLKKVKTITYVMDESLVFCKNRDLVTVNWLKI